MEQRAEKADKMARLVHLIAGIEDDKSAYASKRNAEIKAFEADLAKLADEVSDGAEERAQLDLFVGQNQAHKGLADVAEHACTCPGGPDASVKAIDCPAHGADSRGPNPGDRGEEPATSDVNAADLAETLRKSEVDVGTVGEPAAVKQHRAKGTVH